MFSDFKRVFIKRDLSFLIEKDIGVVKLLLSLFLINGSILGFTTIILSIVEPLLRQLFPRLGSFSRATYEGTFLMLLIASIGLIVLFIILILGFIGIQFMIIKFMGSSVSFKKLFSKSLSLYSLPFLAYLVPLNLILEFFMTYAHTNTVLGTIFLALVFFFLFISPLILFYAIYLHVNFTKNIANLSLNKAIILSGAPPALLFITIVIIVLALYTFISNIGLSMPGL